VQEIRRIDLSSLSIRTYNYTRLKQRQDRKPENRRQPLKTSEDVFKNPIESKGENKVAIKLHTGEPDSPNILPRDMLNYDSMVVLTHFKGHAMGGFGGSMKNIAIGCADGPIGKKIVFINVLRNMSADCDCAGTNAAPVRARNLGILASSDLLAIEQASIDLVYQLPEAELHDLKERIESRKGLRQLTYMKEMKMGNDRYKLITL